MPSLRSIGLSANCKSERAFSTLVAHLVFSHYSSQILFQRSHMWLALIFRRTLLSLCVLLQKSGSLRAYNLCRLMSLPAILAALDFLTRSWHFTSLNISLKRRCRSEEHTSELQSHSDLVCRLLLEKKKIPNYRIPVIRAPDTLKFMQDRRIDIPFIIVSDALGEQTAQAAAEASAHVFIFNDILDIL